jgi:predicted transcriptional regulator
MTRTHALHQLLRHGRMGYAEIEACTRWPRRRVEVALRACIQLGHVVRRSAEGMGMGRYVYEAKDLLP